MIRLPGGSALRYQQFSVAGGLDASSATRMETFVELALLGLRFDLSLAEADHFIQGTVGRESVQAPFDLTMRWSSREGLSFYGSGGLHVSLPLQQAIGPVKLDAAHIGIDVGEAGIDRHKNAKTINRTTKEVIHQMPWEEMLAIAKTLNSIKG